MDDKFFKHVVTKLEQLEKKLKEKSNHNINVSTDLSKIKKEKELKIIYEMIDKLLKELVENNSNTIKKIPYNTPNFFVEMQQLILIQKKVKFRYQFLGIIIC